MQGLLLFSVQTEEKKKKKKKKKKKSKSKKESDDTAEDEISDQIIMEISTKEAAKSKRQRSISESSVTDTSDSTRQASKKETRKRDRAESSDLSEEGRPAKRKHSNSEEQDSSKYRKLHDKEDAPSKLPSSELTECREISTEEEKDISDKKETSACKVKRKRKKKHRERHRVGEEVIPLRVLSKEMSQAVTIAKVQFFLLQRQEWLDLKTEYLTQQRASMSFLKKSISGRNYDSMGEMEAEQTKQISNVKDVNVVKNEALGPQFVNGVIVKITSLEPFPNRQHVKIISQCSKCTLERICLPADSAGALRMRPPFWKMAAPREKTDGPRQDRVHS
ncbi:unnamed protein product [Ranitomeya imitator]|uniref:Uncharacterized protein n=1 Tax=Ranitomeya imitator TaxID=111125 RepID=A0ABN9MLM2_9NEOB|nr:unnamed protein product [Ranitomeya imitator]